MLCHLHNTNVPDLHNEIKGKGKDMLELTLLWMNIPFACYRKYTAISMELNILINLSVSVRVNFVLISH